MSDKLLSLCMIVGPGEAKELKRCLESCKGDLFDEICVTHAAKEKDEEVWKTALEYTDKVTFFEWVDNFSKARNYNFSQAGGEHILWLDADDVLKPEDYKKLLELKPTLRNFDLIMIQYVYAHDDQDRPVVILPRERIVRNCEEIKWHDAIHEYLNMNAEFRMTKKHDIFVHHYRTKPFDPNRNLSLLKQAYDGEEVTPRIRFYYGKELAENGRWEEAVPVLEDYISRGDGFPDNLTVACIKLSRYYYSRKQLNDAKATAMKGIHFNNGYAENYVLIGDSYFEQGHKEAAIGYYEEAMTKQVGGTGMSQLADYYRFIPAWRLTSLYMGLQDFSKAEKYCRIALEEKPEHQELSQMLSAIQRERINRSGDVVFKDDTLAAFVELGKKYAIELDVEDNNVEFARIKATRRILPSVAWLVPHLDLNNPSIRLRRFNIHEKLKAMGVESKMISGYYGKSVYDIRNEIGDANVVIVTQFGNEDYEIMRYLKAQGKKLAYDHNEALFGYPMEGECFKESDVVVCCSTVLAEMTKNLGFGPVAVIKDAIEEFEAPSPVYENRYERPKAVYMGMGGNSFLANDWLRETVEKAGYELVTITEWENATIRWNPKTWPQDLCNCDVVLCPQRKEVQPAKSNVKVTTAMALGLPVIATPIQSYKEVIQHEINGFLADGFEEWNDALEKLKDPEYREKIGKKAKESVSAYTLESVAENWKKLCTDLMGGKVSEKELTEKVSVPNVAPKAREQVDLIVSNYNNLRYLKLLYNSIMLNTLYPFHLVISDAGSNEETWNYLKSLKGITVLGEQGKRINFSEACNAGIQATRGKYFAILNSDLIVSKGWLTNIIDKMETTDRLAACGVLSNCDRGWLHGIPGKPSYPMKLEKAGIELVPGMKYEEIQPHQEELYAFMEESNKKMRGKFVEQDWVAYYATVFARSAVNEVGLLDTRFKNGCEDLDHCRRMGKFFFKTGQALDSFVYHFGGVSRGAYQEENREAYDQEDKMNHIMFQKKWEKKRVVIWTGRAWEPWNKEKVNEGMAGSETWATYLAESLVREGYDVSVYNDLKIEDQTKPLFEPVPGTDKFVKYRHYPYMLDDLQSLYVDHFIASRSTDPLAHRLHTHNHYVMIHDIWLSQDRNYDIRSWKVRKYAYLSEWHKKFLMHHHNMPEDKMFLTANGVVQEWYQDVDVEAKKNQAVYSSSPDRGLLQLLQMMPRIRESVPDFELVVAYGFYNWEEACKVRKDEVSLALIDKIKKLLDQPGVNYVGRINKLELAKYQKESKVWLYPSWFEETFCIGATENGLSKNAILTTGKAGILTTVQDSGILLSPEGLTRDGDYPQEYQDKFVNEAVRLLTNEDYRRLWAGNAYGKMLSYTWDKIAKDWVKLFKEYEED